MAGGAADPPDDNLYHISLCWAGHLIVNNISMDKLSSFCSPFSPPLARVSNQTHLIKSISRLKDTAKAGKYKEGNTSVFPKTYSSLQSEYYSEPDVLHQKGNLHCKCFFLSLKNQFPKLQFECKYTPRSKEPFLLPSHTLFLGAKIYLLDKFLLIAP